MRVTLEMQLVATCGDGATRKYDFGYELKPHELEAALDRPLVFEEAARQLARELARKFVHDVRSKKWPPPMENPDTPGWARGKGM